MVRMVRSRSTPSDARTSDRDGWTSSRGYLATVYLPLVLALSLPGHANALGGLMSRVYMEPCEQGQGVCMTTGECRVRAGLDVGTCLLGTCCRIAKSCGDTAILNNTFFVDGASNSGSSCSLEVRKVPHRDGVCQMRLDFIEFETVGPETLTGRCNVDSFQVSGQNNLVPNICGSNSKQHIYLDVRGRTSSVQLRFRFGAANRGRRGWKISIRQIPCRSERLAPTGCLQYHEEPTGEIKSFNYGNPTEKTYPLEGMQYAVCFRENCELQLRKAGLFGLSAAAENQAAAAANMDNNMDQQCFKPTDRDAANQLSYLGFDNARFCKGNFFSDYLTVTPISRVDVMMYERETNRQETWVGFYLTYTQRCRV